MRKVDSGGQRIRKEHLLITRYALPSSPRWVLSCVNGYLYTKVDQVNVGSSTVRLVEICSPSGETTTMTSAQIPAAK